MGVSVQSVDDGSATGCGQREKRRHHGQDQGSAPKRVYQMRCPLRIDEVKLRGGSSHLAVPHWTASTCLAPVAEAMAGSSVDHL